MSFHSGLGIPVAVKILKPHLIEEDPEFLDRFIQEGRLAVSLHHKNIVRIFDAGKAGDSYYLVMELLEGKDALETLSSQGAFSVEKTLEIGCAVADALIEAHEHGIIHRDIKPDNILISSEGKIKLADLGLAKKLGDEYSSTISGTTIGTPNYMSPEQALNSREADARSDIYSLGATLYHLLTGTLPFEGNSIMEVMMKHANAPLVAPQERKDGLPPKICNVIVKMMDKNPDKRYQSCEEVLTALNKIRYAPSADEKPKTHTLKTKKFKKPSQKIEEYKVHRENIKEPKKRSRFLLAGVFLLILIPLSAMLFQSGKAKPEAVEAVEPVPQEKRSAAPAEEPVKSIDILSDARVPKIFSETASLKNGILEVHPRDSFFYLPVKGTFGNCIITMEYMFTKPNTYGKIGLLKTAELTTNLIYSSIDNKNHMTGDIQLKEGPGPKYLYSTAYTAVDRNENPLKKWNKLVVRLEGTRLSVDVNGKKVCDFTTKNEQGQIVILVENKAHAVIRKFTVSPLK